MRRGVGVALAGLAAGGLAMLAGPAGAQLLPPVPAPPPPPLAQPVLELIGPIAYPACGNAQLAIALAPGLVAASGAPLPPDVLTLFGPVVVVCGAVPPSADPQQCSTDATTAQLLDTVSGTTAGTPLPVGVDAAAAIVEEAIVVQDALPPPADATGLVPLVAGVVQCGPATAEPAPGPVPPPSDTAPAPTSPAATAAAPVAPSFGSAAPFFSPAAPVATPAASGAPTAPAATPLRPIVALGGFAYPVVLLLPLVFLVVGGYLGWALTRPVQLPDARRAGLA